MKGNRTVLEAKRYGIYSCRQTTPLLEASRQMVAEDISALVVVDDEGYLAGLISRTDLLRAHLERDDWATQPVEKFMSTDVVTVTPEMTLLEVAHGLLDHCIHRVVVVRDENGRQRPVAVVSAADLVYHMVKEA